MKFNFNFLFEILVVAKKIWINASGLTLLIKKQQTEQIITAKYIVDRRTIFIFLKLYKVNIQVTFFEVIITKLLPKHEFVFTQTP
jgi:hypothetical protein